MKAAAIALACGIGIIGGLSGCSHADQATSPAKPGIATPDYPVSDTIGHDEGSPLEPRPGP